MKLNYQEMINNFGLSYQGIYFVHSANPAHITEIFRINSYSGFSDELTLEKAIEKLKNEIKERKEEEFKRLEAFRQDFKYISFFKKISWQIKNLKLNFDSKILERQKTYSEYCDYALNNIQIKMIDKDKVYNLKAPYFINRGDIFYVAVTDVNNLDIGVYKATVSSTSYFLNDSGIIDFQGILSIMKNEEEEIFNFSTNDSDFKSGHSYHNIFINEKDAIAFHNENMRNKIKKMESLIIEVEPRKNHLEEKSVNLLPKM